MWLIIQKEWRCWRRKWQLHRLHWEKCGFVCESRIMFSISCVPWSGSKEPWAKGHYDLWPNPIDRKCWWNVFSTSAGCCKNAIRHFVAALRDSMPAGAFQPLPAEWPRPSRPSRPGWIRQGGREWWCEWEDWAWERAESVCTKSQGPLEPCLPTCITKDLCQQYCRCGLIQVEPLHLIVVVENAPLIPSRSAVVKNGTGVVAP